MTRAVVFVNAAVLLILAAVGLSGARRVAPPPIPLELPSVVIPPEVALPVDPPTPAVIQVMSGDEVFAMVCDWIGKKRCGSDEEVIRPWTDAISLECGSRDECTLLASQMWVESRFERWVLDGSCNDEAWRLKQPPGWMRSACDGGWAIGGAQLHAGGWLVRDNGIPATRDDLLEPRSSTHLALKLLRKMPSAWTTYQRARAHAAWAKAQASR